MTALGRAVVLRGDARHLPLLDASVDAIVCDPPYALEFMGKDWDRHSSPQAFQDWCLAWAQEALRVLKPGGHMLAFGGTRTYHRMVCGIEDAGFEIRDSIHWIYGTGFPKSLDVSKAIDAVAGAERPVVGVKVAGASSLERKRKRRVDQGYRPNLTSCDPSRIPVTAAATEEAQRWSGWGTALKPAHEPIVVARKPLAGTVADNVLAYSTGALNINGCRVAATAGDYAHPGNDNRHQTTSVYGRFEREGRQAAPHTSGRWPPNVVLDGEAAGELDTQSGLSTSHIGNPRGAAPGVGWGMTATGAEYEDEGGASRFFPVFRYEPKAPTGERPVVGDVSHPTVKPLDLIRWLCRLVTPPGGVVLDQFAGSGTTAEAALLEGFRPVVIERDADYIPLILARLSNLRPAGPVMLRRPKPRPSTPPAEGMDALFDLEAPA